MRSVAQRNDGSSEQRLSVLSAESDREGQGEHGVVDSQLGSVHEMGRQVTEHSQQSHLLEGVGGQHIPNHTV